MSTSRREKNGRDPWQEKPGFTTFYDLGVIVSRQLPAHKTFREIGAKFGITKQNAYTEAMVALGKLCYHMRELRKAEKDFDRRIG